MIPKSANVVIIGAGISGCATAYELTKLGVNDVVVLEKDYVSSGATGRCGAGVRQQWGLKYNALLAQKSVEIFENLSDELGMDIEFRQGGYLVLAHTESQVEQFKKNIELQNSLGIPSRFVSKEEAREICPPINTDAFLTATFCHTDGHANPFLTNFAYMRAAERNGVKIFKNTEVIGLDVSISSRKIVGVRTNKGYISCPIVVNAAGGHSRLIAQMAGVDIPVFPERHQILATEPLEPLFDTMVISFQIGIYVQQVPHGSFVMGIGEKEEPSFEIRSTWQFLEHITKELINLLPVMRDVRIVRQWAGLYDKSLDAAPILGPDPRVEGLYHQCGFSGHGFMIAPMCSRVMAQKIAGVPTEIDISPLSVERFEKGELIIEPAVVG